MHQICVITKKALYLKAVRPNEFDLIMARSLQMLKNVSVSTYLDHLILL